MSSENLNWYFVLHQRWWRVLQIFFSNVWMEFFVVFHYHAQCTLAAFQWCNSIWNYRLWLSIRPLTSLMWNRLLTVPVRWMIPRIFRTVKCILRIESTEQVIKFKMTRWNSPFEITVSIRGTIWYITCPRMMCCSRNPISMECSTKPIHITFYWFWFGADISFIEATKGSLEWYIIFFHFIIYFCPLHNVS